MILAAYCSYLGYSKKQVIAEKDRYAANTEAALSKAKRLQIDSNTMALQVKSLTLTSDEYEKYRAEDAKNLKKSGVNINRVQAIARHDLDINAPIVASVKDSIIYTHDTTRVHVNTVRMATPYIQLQGQILNDTLKGSIRLSVTLQQSIWVDYKWKFLFLHGKVKNVYQTISSNNPYVEIKYSEFINIKN